MSHECGIIILDYILTGVDKRGKHNLGLIIKLGVYDKT